MVSYGGMIRPTLRSTLGYRQTDTVDTYYYFLLYHIYPELSRGHDVLSLLSFVAAFEQTSVMPMHGLIPLSTAIAHQGSIDICWGE